MVCRSCGSEVSPYVTECPYCGHRLRKRAPKLEREGDEIRVRETRRERRRRGRRERRARREPRRSVPGSIAGRPLATIATILAGAAVIVVARAVPLSLAQSGAIVGPVDGELWRYLTAPFVTDDVGAFFVVALAIWIFGTAVEQRIGTLATAILIFGTGALGMLAADAVVANVFDSWLVACGGNGIALGLIGAWLPLRRAEAEAEGGFADPIDLIGVVVVVVVVLLVPLVESGADPLAGVVGGLVGLGMGALAVRRLGAGAG